MSASVLGPLFLQTPKSSRCKEFGPWLAGSPVCRKVSEQSGCRAASRLPVGLKVLVCSVLWAPILHMVHIGYVVASNLGAHTRGP